MVLQEGPIDESLLTFQQSHRSHSIWANDGEPPVDSKTIKVRRSQSKLKKFDPLAPPVLQLIRQAGFGGVIDLPFISLDIGLMTALLERWRPETHSFHLRTGEWTVTLQDVEVLLGLPIDGEPIIGSTNEDWDLLCQRLLGIVPENKVDRKGGKVTMTWLREHFKGHLAAGYTEENVQQHARGYILQLIGGVLMLTFQQSHRSHSIWANDGEPPVDSKTIKVRRSQSKLKKFDPLAPPVLQLIRQAGFGGVIDLPFISLDIGLMTALLEHWRPETHSFHLRTGEWTVTLQDVEVIWRPYSEELIASLPPSCRAGRAIWMAKVPLLNFPMVQMHMRDRVMRQFGLRQTIPAHCNCRQPLHEKNWKAGQKDYRQDHHAELEMWNHRLNHIVPAGEADPHEYAYPADDPYVTWYERITIPYISRLGGGADKAMRLFERLRTMEDIDLHEVRSIGEEGVGAMAYLEKWLRKRPPIDPNQPQAQGVNVAEEVHPLHEPAIEVDPLIHNDPIPDTMDAGTSSAPQDADGGFVSSSFTAHLGSVPSYPFTLMF
ncbi:hypothetical protein RHMOL_Rhmol09G0081200 [Rhododendron molle]|uniref:Uncharacterized protein n=1 Tax=Rhododendron molle TaxID=49168 RepID=A0ACC0MBE9_RHOML|nr:hypothetical protein RHMOL_Rhmol09G0081200 [Rhododendron molle]